MDLVFKGTKNQHGLSYKKLIAAEQEFNTLTYGIKGNIDCTVVTNDNNGRELSTALEIKTGRHKSLEYDG